MHFNIAIFKCLLFRIYSIVGVNNMYKLLYDNVSNVRCFTYTPCRAGGKNMCLFIAIFQMFTGGTCPVKGFSFIYQYFKCSLLRI